MSYATLPTIAAVATPPNAIAAGPAAAPILANVGANFANAPPAENAFLMLPTASTVLPAHLISPVEPFVIAPIATTVAPAVIMFFFCASSIDAIFCVYCDTPFDTSTIVGNIKSPNERAISTTLFFATDNLLAVVSALASNSSCNAVFSLYAVFERLTLSVTKS